MAKKETSKKTTSPGVAKKASEVLKSPDTGKASKSAAGSALSQSKIPKKATSENAASKASKVLRDGRTGKASKSAAGSALSQREKKSVNKTSGTGPRKK
ncbi:MAG TPA: hypothetical protein DER09_15575 [Prolixibacteraceae bacterium]|nr:hypothetical protein [Prolixibacteraceae bacterium]